MSKALPEPRSDAVPTAWDVFLAVHVAAPCTRADLVRRLLLPDAEPLKAPLEAAIKDKLVQPRAGKFEPRADARARNLSRALQVALAYRIDYNTYSCRAMTKVLQIGYGKPYFALEALDPEFMWAMLEDGLMLAYSYRPPVFRLVPNPFLEALGAHLGLRLPPPTSLEAPLVAAMRPERVRALRLRDRQPDLDPPARRGLSSFQRLLRHDLEQSEEGILDPQGLRRQRDCREKVCSNVAAGVPLSVPVIREYHSLLMGGEPEGGVFRTAEVTVVNNPYFRTAPPDQVADLLEDLVERYRKRRPVQVEDFVHDAAWLGNELLYIHPFEDGNSRAARAVLAHFLGEHGSPLAGVPATFEMMFLVGSKGSKSRNDEALEDVVWDMVIHTVNRAELALRRAG